MYLTCIRAPLCSVDSPIIGLSLYTIPLRVPIYVDVGGTDDTSPNPTSPGRCPVSSDDRVFAVGEILSSVSDIRTLPTSSVDISQCCLGKGFSRLWCRLVVVCPFPCKNKILPVVELLQRIIVQNTPLLDCSTRSHHSR